MATQIRLTDAAAIEVRQAIEDPLSVAVGGGRYMIVAADFPLVETRKAGDFYMAYNSMPRRN